ncbi:hypothetical protein GCM10009839_29050 [Catenulispora yoronensis]|uniref:DUF937 domain-containing protein n=1 Tax=Catenulispora yoronensis TaxID=450799 RepID=A0ABN2UAF3_9ACTN
MAGFDIGSLLNSVLGGSKQQGADGSQDGRSASGGGAGGLGGLVNADMLAKLGPMISSLMAGGGLSKLMGQLKGGGLGDQAKSWVSADRPNEPVTGEQLSEALGPDTISKFANTMGMTNEQAAQTMAQTLPGVVDAMTPDGKVPESVGSEAGGASSAAGATPGGNAEPGSTSEPGS